MPTQMTRKPMTSVIICIGGAERPLNKTIVVIIEKKVTAKQMWSERAIQCESEDITNRSRSMSE